MSAGRTNAVEIYSAAIATGDIAGVPFGMEAQCVMSFRRPAGVIA